jgi:hypothetical protein
MVSAHSEHDGKPNLEEDGPSSSTESAADKVCH